MHVDLVTPSLSHYNVLYSCKPIFVASLNHRTTAVLQRASRKGEPFEPDEHLVTTVFAGISNAQAYHTGLDVLWSKHCFRG